MMVAKKAKTKKKPMRRSALLNKIDAMWELKEIIDALDTERDTYKREIKEEMEKLGISPSRTLGDGTKIPGDKVPAEKCIAYLVAGKTGSKINPVKLLESGVSTATIEKCTDKGKPTLSLRLDMLKE